MNKPSHQEKDCSMEFEKDYPPQDLTEKLSFMNFFISPQPLFFRDNRNFKKNESDCSEPNLITQNNIDNDIDMKQKEGYHNKDTDSVQSLEKIESQKNSLNSQRFFKIVQVFCWVQKFLKNLKKTSKKMLANKNLPFEMLNDPTFFNFKPNQSENFLDLIKRMIKKAFSYNLKRNSLFEFFFILIITLNLIFVPFNEAFGNYAMELKGTSLLFWLISSFLIFLINLLKNIVSQKNDNNENKSKYIDFFNDLSPCLYFLVKMFLNNSMMLVILLIPSIRILRVNVEKIEYMFLKKDKQRAFMSFCKLIFCIFLLIHSFACISIYFGQIQKEFETGWIFLNDLSFESNMKIYLISMYNLIFGVFFLRDPNSSTDLEKAYNLTFVGVASILFFWNFHSIFEILKNFHKIDENLKRKKDAVSAYLSENEIDYIFKLKVDKYIENIHNASPEIEIQDILNKLPSSLRLELFQSKNGDVCQKIPFLSFFSKEFSAKFFQQMEDKIYCEQDLIMEKNNEDPCFYLIENGMINICMNGIEKPQVILQVNQGECFGDFLFFIDERLRFSIDAASNSTKIKSIKRSSFLKLVKENQSDYEKFCFLRDQVNVNRDFCFLLEKCKSCRDPNHNILNCIHEFIFSKQSIIHNYNFSYPNRRSRFQRSKRPKLNSLYKNKKILQAFRLKGLISSGGSLMTDQNDDIDESIKKENSNDKSLTSTIGMKAEKSEEFSANTSLEMILWRNKDKIISKKTQEIKEETESEIDYWDYPKKNETETDKSKFNVESRGLSVLIEEKPLEIDLVGNFRFYFKDNNFPNLTIKNCKVEKKEEETQRNKISNVKMKKNKRKKIENLNKNFQKLWSSCFGKCFKLKKQK